MNAAKSSQSVRLTVTGPLFQRVQNLASVIRAVECAFAESFLERLSRRGIVLFQGIRRTQMIKIECVVRLLADGCSQCGDGVRGQSLLVEGPTQGVVYLVGIRHA